MKQSFRYIILLQTNYLGCIRQKGGSGEGRRVATYLLLQSGLVIFKLLKKRAFSLLCRECFFIRPFLSNHIVLNTIVIGIEIHLNIQHPKPHTHTHPHKKKSKNIDRYFFSASLRPFSFSNLPLFHQPNHFQLPLFLSFLLLSTLLPQPIFPLIFLSISYQQNTY